ncbi:hypothetical protein [Kitasatospora sp. MBT63]|uniref:hypothetical protein n=1 Tax=Kitasatospora sp. MBT63 TaxID=1444768 RepID=UPI000539CCAE|nr:hypothetical protein [Kitasatospora sp. MBT63]
MSLESHNEIRGGQFGATVQARSIESLTINPAAPAHRPPVQRQLPRRPAHFLDRSDITAYLTEELARTPDRIHVVHSPAGIGKSALAVELLTRLPCPPGGQLYADLRGAAVGGPARDLEILARLLRSLGWDGPWQDPAEAAAWFRSATAERPVALLLDDAASAEQVRAVLPATGSTVLVTSRSVLPGLVAVGAEHHELGPLPAAEAVELLTLLAGTRHIPDPQAARATVEACRNRPLLIALAAARLQTRPGAAALPDPDDSMDVITVHLTESYRALPEDAAAAYRAAGTVPFSNITEEMLAAVLATDRATARRSLAALEQAGLMAATGDAFTLVPAGDGQRAAADLAQLTDSPEQLTEQRRRALEWWLAALTRAERHLAPHHRELDRTYLHPATADPHFDSREQAWAWLAGQEEQIRPALAAAEEAGWDDLAWQMVHALWPLWHRLRPYELWLWACQLAVDAARRTGDGLVLREMLNQHAVALRGLHRPADALPLIEEALDLARRDGDQRGEGQHRHEIGATLVEIGRDNPGDLPSVEQAAAARPHLTEARQLREQTGYRRGAAVTDILLGQVHAALGDHDQALAALDRARETLLAVDDLHDAARALAWRGRIQLLNGETANAARALHHAQSEFAAAGSRAWEALALEWRADAAEAAGRRDKVDALLRAALAVYGGSPRDAGRIQSRLEQTSAGSGAEPPGR